MRRIWLIVPTVVTLVAIFAVTPTPPSVALRQWLGQTLVDAGQRGLAREVYRTLMQNGDPLGTNNYAVLRHWDSAGLAEYGPEYNALIDEVKADYSYAYQSGLAAASYNLGMLYYQREYQPEAYAFAKAHLRVAAAAGDETARLAYALNMFVLSNHPDYPERVAALEALVADGSALGMLELAFNMHGEGKHDREVALLEQAALAGNFYALESLVTSGERDVPVDSWLPLAEQSAMAGSHKVQLMLGEAYKHGYYGLPKDHAKAGHWLAMAALANYVRAPDEIGPQFDVTGFKWRQPTYQASIDGSIAAKASDELASLDPSGR